MTYELIQHSSSFIICRMLSQFLHPILFGSAIVYGFNRLGLSGTEIRPGEFQGKRNSDKRNTFGRMRSQNEIHNYGTIKKRKGFRGFYLTVCVALIREIFLEKRNILC